MSGHQARHWNRVSIGGRRALVESGAAFPSNALAETAALEAELASNVISQAELARRIGRSGPYVSNFLRLRRLAPRPRLALERGDITASHAKSLVALSAELQERLTYEIIHNGWSAKRLEQELVVIRGRRRSRT